MIVALVKVKLEGVVEVDDIEINGVENEATLFWKADDV